jgi:Flp pilus assembly protein TadD
MPASPSLTPEQTKRLRAAFEALRSGDPRRALAVARELASAVPGSADAWHVVAMGLAELGDRAGADQAFRRALQLAPRSAEVGLNFSRWLSRDGRLQDALQVLEALPDSAPVCLQRGLVAARAGEHARARVAFEQATRLDPGSHRAWHGLGNALRALDQPEAADAAFERATTLAPENPRAWIGRAVVLRLLGRLGPARACLDQARRRGYAGPELDDVLVGVLHDAGEASAALAHARQLVERHPDYVDGHATLAHLLWEHGPGLAPGEDPFAAFVRAARRRAGDRGLLLRLSGMLTSAGRATEALALLEPAMHRDRDDPVLQWFCADAHARLGRLDEAGRLYAAARPKLERSSPAFLDACARHALRTGDPGLAGRCAAQAVALDPRNQEGWALLSVCWRLAGDPREWWLCDYERLIAEVEVDLDPAHAPGALERLEQRLHALHQAAREPMAQSVRTGSQTPGRLFGRDDPVLGAAAVAIRRAVEAWLPALPRDPAHPFLSRVDRGIRYCGSWSVRLQSSGRHANHIHNEGWLSSAFYVALPPSMLAQEEGDHAGWIQFGQPLEELGLELPPRRVIRPRPGRLVLFPSYMWHGTIPFSDDRPRLTIAFDAQPAPAPL